MVKGELTVVKEAGDVLHLKAGDTIIEVVEAWHSGKNEGSETAEIVVFYMGAPGLALSIKEPVETVIEKKRNGSCRLTVEKEEE